MAFTFRNFVSTLSALTSVLASEKSRYMLKNIEYIHICKSPKLGRLAQRKKSPKNSTAWLCFGDKRNLKPYWRARKTILYFPYRRLEYIYIGICIVACMTVIKLTTSLCKSVIHEKLIIWHLARSSLAKCHWSWDGISFKGGKCKLCCPSSKPDR